MEGLGFREVAALGGLGLSRIVPVVKAWGLPVSEPLRLIAVIAGGKLNRVAPDELAAVLSHRPKLGDVHNVAEKDYYFAQAMEIGVVLCELDDDSGSGSIE